jgi:hypothetical protein
MERKVDVGFTFVLKHPEISKNLLNKYLKNWKRYLRKSR